MMMHTFTISEEERRVLWQLLNNAWHDLDQERMLARPDSPEEKSLLAEQLMVQGIQGNLNKKTVTPS